MIEQSFSELSFCFDFVLEHLQNSTWPVLCRVVQPNDPWIETLSSGAQRRQRGERRTKRHFRPGSTQHLEKSIRIPSYPFHKQFTVGVLAPLESVASLQRIFNLSPGLSSLWLPSEGGFSFSSTCLLCLGFVGPFCLPLLSSFFVWGQRWCIFLGISDWSRFCLVWILRVIGFKNARLVCFFACCCLSIQFERGNLALSLLHNTLNYLGSEMGRRWRLLYQGSFLLSSLK